LGTLVDKAGARFKSDEKALELIRLARLAIGGDQAIAGIRSLTINGKTSVTFKTKDGDRTEQGATEIALQLPNNFMKMTRIGNPGIGSETAIREQHDVLVLRRTDGSGEFNSADGKKVIVKKMESGEEVARTAGEGKEGEFTTSDGKTIVIRRADGSEHDVLLRTGPGGEPMKIAKGDHVELEKKIRAAHEGMRQNELARMTLALLLSAPEGLDVSYTFAGETDVDGSACNVVSAEFAGTSVKLYLSKASSLPVMISYIGHQVPRIFNIKVKAPEGAEPPKENMVFRRVDGGAKEETAEYQVRFSDYRSVNGVQLPYRWTTSVAGQTTEVFDVTAYDVNPANIGEKFQAPKVFVRKPKTDSN
jgi:hypothetical protein